MPKRGDPSEIEPRPRPVPEERGATPAQLKRDIEAGATGDKVPVLDPGLAPLGTDDEAAGTGPGPRLVAEARRAERTGPPSQEYPGSRRDGSGRTRLIASIVLLVMLGVLAAWFGLS